MVHIHGTSPNQYAAQMYSTAQDRRALEARRAADTRRKLSRSAEQLSALDEETSFVQQISDSLAQGANNPYAGYPQRDRSLG